LRGLVLALAMLVVFFLCGAGDVVGEESGGVVNVLYIGDMIRPSPYPILEAEPLIDVRVAWPVGPDLTQGSLAFAKKALRQYIPRTYEEMEGSDVVVIDNPDVSIFEPKYLFWFRDVVVEGGAGLLMVGGNAAFGGRPNPSWGPTPVQDVLPVWVVEMGWLEPGRFEVVRPDHPFVSSLPLDRRWEWMEVLGGNEVVVKDGAGLLAEYIHAFGGWVNPFWVAWDVGEGRSLAQTVDWTPAGGTLLMKWPYYEDYAVNLMLYLGKRPIPVELDLVHEIRGKYIEYRSTKAYLFSVMEFAEKMGANMLPVSEMIEEADEKRGESVGEYLGYEFQAALGLLESSIEDLRSASERAMELKDEAMVWIFVIEWLVVSATFSLGGFVLWTLMVSRRLYRDIGSTRFGR